jgi:ABC-type sugar transport system ATPase subunit
MAADGSEHGDDCVLRVSQLTKAFGGIRALGGVDLEVRAGEVHALVGENGAGKSTLVKVVAGFERADSGLVAFRGEAVRFRGPHEALARGIHLIHQELMSFPDLTVAENLFAGREVVRGWWRRIDRGEMRRRTRELLSEVGIDADPRARMGDLTVAQMQGVEIARALAHKVQLLIWDEPTSALSCRETERLFGIVRRLAQQGVAQVYISHKLDEVFRLAQRLTVLRDGQRVLACAAGEATPAGLIEAMVGRELGDNPHAVRSAAGELLLEVRGLGGSDRSEEGVLRVHRGEVVGLAGLIGAGRTRLVASLYGLTRAQRGSVRFRGRDFWASHPAAALRAGLAMVTEDRQRWGLVETMSVQENLLLSAGVRDGARWWLDRQHERELARRWIGRLGVKAADLSQPVSELSGGNQQKIVLGRALATCPELLILDEPTRGIDVAAKAEIYGLIRTMRDQGMGILLVSSELPELLALSDRILVVCEGRVTAHFNAGKATEENLLAHAMPRGRGDMGHSWALGSRGGKA